MNDLISVIVPIYNVEKYLRNCIDSIINQTYKNLEIILVDDGSPDNCPKICDDYAKLDSRIKVIHKKNDGPSIARNTGIQFANGEWIIFVDADDFYCNLDAYNIIINYLNNNKDIDCLIFRYRTLHNNISLNKSWNKEMITSRDEVAYRKLKHPSPYWHYLWNKIYKTAIIKQNNIKFSEHLKNAEDVKFNNDFLKYSKNYYIITNYLYSYNCSNTNSLSHGEVFDSYDKLLTSYTNIRDELIGLIEIYKYIGLYDKCKKYILKLFYEKTINLLLKSGEFIEYNDFKKMIYSDDYFKKISKKFKFTYGKIILKYYINKLKHFFKLYIIK